ncbi:MAG: hypothetical protein ACRCUM_00650 [Mycoplasmoidaceae bacterium]
MKTMLSITKSFSYLLTSESTKCKLFVIVNFCVSDSLTPTFHFSTSACCFLKLPRISFLL